MQTFSNQIHPAFSCGTEADHIHPFTESDPLHQLFLDFSPCSNNNVYDNSALGVRMLRFRSRPMTLNT